MRYLTLIIIFFLSCTKKEAENPLPSYEEVIIENLNLGGTIDSGLPVEGQNIYFNLSKAGIVSSTEPWDICFMGLYNTEIRSNSAADIYMNILNTSYSQIETKPAIHFPLSSIGSAGRTAEGWYNYDSEAHVVRPVQGKTIFIRNKDGIYKLMMISIYKGAPAFPTMADEAPYLSFRYKRIA